MKTIVYTCITGNYDSIIELSKKEKDFEYICITNNKDLKSKTWNIKYIDENLDNWTLARKVKIKPFEYLPKHELSVYIDGAVLVRGSISQLLKDECELDKYDMIGFKHQERDCIYDEINTCVDYRRESIENALKIEEFLKKEKYPRHNGLNESTVLIRKNQKDVNELMDLWFYMITNYTRRDQLSFNYCLWKKPIKIKVLDMWVFDNKYFKHMGHNKIKYLDYRLSFNDINSFDFHFIEEGKVIITDNKVSIKTKCLKDTNKIVIQLPNEIGNIVSNVKVNNKKCPYELSNAYEINSKDYFFDLPSIIISGNYRKGNTLEISFSIEENNKRMLVEDIYRFKCANKDLKDENKKMIEVINSKEQEVKNQNKKYGILEKSYNDIINSKAWKLADKLRKIKHKIIRK